MNILVACEESQRVATAFRNKGHNAFSCDILPCSGGHPEYHIQGDVLELLSPCYVMAFGHSCIPFVTMDGVLHVVEKWDMLIAFPPCTYMTAASACRMYPTAGYIDLDRFAKAQAAKSFFMSLYNSYIDKICIENPKPLRCVGLPVPSCRIQPYYFGHPYSKLTYLWLKGLPSLLPTNLITENIVPFVSAGSKTSSGILRKNVGFVHSQSERSKTFLGVAAAMAEQWG